MSTHGSTVYGQLEEVRQRTQTTLKAAQQALQQLDEARQAHQATQQGLLMAFAGVVLHEASAEPDRFTALEGSVQQLMAQRTQAQQTEQAQWTHDLDARQALTAPLTAAEHALAQAQAAWTAFETQAHGALAETALFQTQAQAAAEQTAIAEQAEQHAAQAQAEAERKRPAFEQDPLFAYLIGCGYTATSPYPNGWRGRLDRWVARLCGFAEHQPNYERLLALPGQMAEHAQRMRAQAQTLTDVVTRARAACQTTPEGQALLHTQAAAQQALAALQAQAQALEASVQAHHDRLQAFGRGEDPQGVRLRELLAEMAQRLTLAQAQALAALTHSPEDDHIPTALAEVAAQLTELARQAQAQAAVVDQAHAAAQRAALLCQTFRQSGWDASDSRFHDGTDWSALAMGVVMGQMAPEHLWGPMRAQHYTYVPPPPPAPSPSPSSGGFGGGGFSSGGGIGGGSGFSTGGGF